MNHMERVLSGIVRNWKRYLIITMVTMVIAASITVTTMVRTAAQKTLENYADRIGISAGFTPDLRKSLALGTDENGYLQIPEITSDKLEEFSESKYIKDTLFTITLRVYGEEIRAVGQESQDNDPYGLSFVPNKKGENENGLVQGNCVLIAYSDFNLAEEFVLGAREIVQGDCKEDEDTCIISKDFVEKNHLQIGDRLQVFNVQEETETFSLLVTGIYSDETVLCSGGNGAGANNRRNEILVSYGTLKGKEITAANVEAVYYLKSAESADPFEREVREKGLPDIYNVNVDADNYYMAMEPVKGLQKIMKIMFFVVTVTGLAVLSLLSVLQVQDRKYELGILRAMGMRKKSVMLMMLTESVIICMTGMILGMGLGSWMSQPIFDRVLEQQIQKAGDSRQDSSQDFGNGVIKLNNESEDSIPMEIYETQVRFTVRTLGVIIVCVLGVLVNSMYLCFLLRREPMKLLIER